MIEPKFCSFSSRLSFLYHDDSISSSSTSSSSSSSSCELCSISLLGVGNIITVSSSPKVVRNETHNKDEKEVEQTVAINQCGVYIPTRFAALTDMDLVIFIDISYSTEQGAFLASEIARVDLSTTTTTLDEESINKRERTITNNEMLLSHSRDLLLFSPDARFLAVSLVNSHTIYILSCSREDVKNIVDVISLPLPQDISKHHVVELSWSLSQCPEVSPAISIQERYLNSEAASLPECSLSTMTRLVLGALIFGIGVTLWRESSFSEPLLFQRIFEGKKDEDEKKNNSRKKVIEEKKGKLDHEKNNSTSLPVSSFSWLQHRIYHNRIHYAWGFHHLSERITSYRIPPVPNFSHTYDKTDEATYLTCPTTSMALNNRNKDEDDNEKTSSSTSSLSSLHHHLVPVPHKPNWSTTSQTEESETQRTNNIKSVLPPTPLSFTAYSLEEKKMKRSNTIDQPASQRLSRVRNGIELLQLCRNSESSQPAQPLNAHRHLRPFQSESSHSENVIDHYLSASLGGRDSVITLSLHRLESDSSSQMNGGTVDVVAANVHIPIKTLIPTKKNYNKRSLTSVRILSAVVEHVVGAHSLSSSSSSSSSSSASSFPYDHSPLDPVPALSPLNEAELEPGEFLDYLHAVTMDLQEGEENLNKMVEWSDASKASGDQPDNTTGSSLRKRTIAALRKSAVFDAAGNARIGEHSGLSLLSRTTGKDSVATTRVKLELCFSDEKDDYDNDYSATVVSSDRDAVIHVNEKCTVTVDWSQQPEHRILLFEVQQQAEGETKKKGHLDNAALSSISSSSFSTSSIDSKHLPGTTYFSSLLELSAGGRLDSKERLNDVILALSIESGLKSQQLDDAFSSFSSSSSSSSSSTAPNMATFPWQTALWALNACIVSENNSNNSNSRDKSHRAAASNSLLQALAVPHTPGSCIAVGEAASQSLLMTRQESNYSINPTSVLDNHKSQAISGEEDEEKDDWSEVFADILQENGKKGDKVDRKRELPSSFSSSSYEKRRLGVIDESLLMGVELDAELVADPCGRAALVSVCTALSQRRAWSNCSSTLNSDDEIDDADRDKGSLSWAGALWALHCPFQESLLKAILDLVERYEAQANHSSINREGESNSSSTSIVSPSPTLATQECVTWSLLCRLKIPLWLKSDASLASLVDRIARGQFLSSGKNPFACMFSHLCISPSRISLVRALFRTSAVSNPAHQRVLAFLDAYDASKGQNVQLRTQAAKNGFALLQAHRPDHAAAFFLLAGRPGQAVKVTLQGGRKDPLMALAVARLIHASSTTSTSIITKKLDFGAFDVVKLVRDANAMVSSTSAVLSPSVMIDIKTNPEGDDHSPTSSQLLSKSKEKKIVKGFGFEDDTDRELMTPTAPPTDSSSFSSTVSTTSSVHEAHAPIFVDPADTDPIAWVLQSEFKALLAEDGAGAVINRPFGFSLYFPTINTSDQVSLIKNKKSSSSSSSTSSTATTNACSRIDGIHDALCLRSLLLWLDRKYLLSVALLVRHCSEMSIQESISSSSSLLSTSVQLYDAPFASQVPAIARVLLSRREWKSSTGAVAASFAALVPFVKKDTDVDRKQEWIEAALSTVAIAAARALIANTNSDSAAIQNSTRRRLGLLSLASAAAAASTSASTSMKTISKDIILKGIDIDNVLTCELTNCLLNCEERLKRLFSRIEEDQVSNNDTDDAADVGKKKEEIDNFHTCLLDDVRIATCAIAMFTDPTTSWVSKTADLCSSAAQEGCWLVSIILASSSSSIFSRELVHATALRYVDVAVSAAHQLMAGKGGERTSRSMMQTDTDDTVLGDDNIQSSNDTFDVNKVLAASRLMRILSSSTDLLSISTSLEVISNYLSILSSIRSHEWRKLITLLSLPQVDMKSSGFIFGLHSHQQHILATASFPGQSLSLLEQWLSAYTGAALHALLCITAFGCLKEQSKRCTVIPFALYRLISSAKTWATRSMTKLATASLVLEPQSSLLYGDAESEAFSWWHHTQKRGQEKEEEKRLLSMRNNGPRAGFIDALMGIGFPSSSSSSSTSYSHGFQSGGQGGNNNAPMQSQLESFATSSINEPIQSLQLPVELDWEAASFLLDQNNIDKEETQESVVLTEKAVMSPPDLSQKMMTPSSSPSRKSASQAASMNLITTKSSSSSSSSSSRWWWTDTMGLFSFSYSGGVYGGSSSSTSSSTSSPGRIRDLHGLCELWDRLGGPGLFWLLGQEQQALQHASTIACYQSGVGLLPSIAPTKSQRTHIIRRSNMHLDKGGREGGGPLAASLVKSVRTLVVIKGLKALTSSPSTSSASQHQVSSSHHQLVILTSLLDHSSTTDEREGSEHSTNSSATNYSNVPPPPAGYGSVNSVSIFKSELVKKHSGNNNDDPHGDGDVVNHESSRIIKTNKLRDMANTAIHAGAVLIERAEASVRPAELDFAAFGGLYDHSHVTTLKNKSSSTSLHAADGGDSTEAEYNGTPDRHEYARPFSFPPLCVRPHPTLPIYIRAGPGTTISSVELVPIRNSPEEEKGARVSSFTHRLHNVYSYRDLPQPPGGATSPRGTNPAFIQSGRAVSADWSLDGKHTIAAFADGIVRLWEDAVPHSPLVECTVPLPEKTSFRVQTPQSPQPHNTSSGSQHHSTVHTPLHSQTVNDVFTWSWCLSDVRPLSMSGHSIAVSASASLSRSSTLGGYHFPQTPATVSEIGSSAFALLQHALIGGGGGGGGLKHIRHAPPPPVTLIPSSQSTINSDHSPPPPPFSHSLFLFDLRASVLPMSSHSPLNHQALGVDAAGITCLLFDEARSQLVLGGADGSLALFCLRTLKTISWVPGIPSVTMVRGVSGGEDKSTNDTFGHLGSVTALSAHPILGASIVASGSEDGDVRLWSLRDSVLSHNLTIPRVHPPALLNGGGGGRGRGGGVTAMVMLEDQVVSGGYDGNIVVSPLLW